MAEFRERRKEIEAEQFLLDSRPWPRGVQTDVRHGHVLLQEARDVVLIVSPGDWITKDRHGNINVLDAAEFAATYEPI